MSWRYARYIAFSSWVLNGRAFIKVPYSNSFYSPLLQQRLSYLQESKRLLYWNEICQQARDCLYYSAEEGSATQMKDASSEMEKLGEDVLKAYLMNRSKSPRQSPKGSTPLLWHFFFLFLLFLFFSFYSCSCSCSFSFPCLWQIIFLVVCKGQLEYYFLRCGPESSSHIWVFTLSTPFGFYLEMKRILI